MPFKAIVRASSLGMGETIGPCVCEDNAVCYQLRLCHSWGPKDEKRGHSALLGRMPLEFTNQSHQSRGSPRCSVTGTGAPAQACPRPLFSNHLPETHLELALKRTTNLTSPNTQILYSKSWLE